MTEIVVFPDATDVIVGYLSDMLDEPVYSRVPATRPSAFVRVQRIGGTELNIVVDDAMLSIECWADVEEDAMDLARYARARIKALRGQTIAGVAIHRIAEISGPALLPDAISDQPRYVFTVLVAMRGDVQQSGS